MSIPYWKPYIMIFSLKRIYKSQGAVSEFWKTEVWAMKVLPEVADSLLGEERLQRVECSEKGEPGFYGGSWGSFL